MIGAIFHLIPLTGVLPCICSRPKGYMLKGPGNFFTEKSQKTLRARAFESRIVPRALKKTSNTKYRKMLHKLGRPISGKMICKITV